jgi:preprotein translocase subunit SecA
MAMGGNGTSMPGDGRWLLPEGIEELLPAEARTVERMRRELLDLCDRWGYELVIPPLVEFTEDKKTRVKSRNEKMVTWKDFRELVLDAVEDAIVSLTDTYAPSRNPTTWNLTALTAEVKAIFNQDMSFTPDGTPEDLQEQIFKRVDKLFVDREKEYGDDWYRFCQLRYLATIDQLWKDHLLAMDNLRQGIGLRGYGQKDPKVEYKKEGYSGFIRMLSSIKSTFVSQIMRAQPRDANADAERLKRVMEQRAKQAVEGRANEEGKVEPAQPEQKTIVREGPKVGRNDPCPCGSGKKYKKCHGATETV